MRNALLACIAWLGALQSWWPFGAGIEHFARLLAIASVLGTLTVLIYRLGVWRQEMENTKHTVVAETKAHREEASVNFSRIERRLDAIDHSLNALAEDRARLGRWRSRINDRLDRLERPRSEPRTTEVVA